MVAIGHSAGGHLAAWAATRPAASVPVTAVVAQAGVLDLRAAWDWHVPFAIVEADPALAAINAGHDRLEGLNKSLAQDAREGFAR